MKKETCQCDECKIRPHYSDCAVHNEPAMQKGKCNCSPMLKDFIKESSEQFDEKFGITITEEDGYKESEGRRAGCDGCQTNCELRDEHKSFLTSELLRLLDVVEGEMDKEKYTFKEVDWGDEMTSTEPVEDENISLNEAVGFNRGIDVVKNIINQIKNN